MPGGQTQRAFVVGAGVSGLTAAFRLRQRGFEVTVLEASSVVAGKMGGTRRDGFVLNRGAQLLPAAYEATLALIRDARIGEFEEFTPVIAVIRDGRRRELRGAGLGMAVDGLRTDLLSARSKLLLPRLAIDAFRMRKALDYSAFEERARLGTETVAEYCDRRLNAEIRDYVIDPLMRGLVLIDAQSMPVVDFLFTAVNLLGSKMLRYGSGYDFLCRGLAERLDVRLESPVESVERTPEGVELRWSDADGQHAETAVGCVIAIPGPSIPAIYPGIDERRAEILAREMDQSSVMGVHLALSRRRDEGVVAITIPAREMEGLTTITFEQVSMPECAPPGKGLISAYFTDDWCAPRMERTDEELLAEMLPMVDQVLPGVTAGIEFTQIDRWSPCTPMYRAGIHALTAELDRLADPTNPIQLAGDFTSFATVNGCVVSGESAARRLAGAIQRGGALSPPPIPQTA